MTGSERREQLVGVGRSLFAERGIDGTSVEEIAAAAGVSKPVVYEHFGGKEGLYAVVVDREMAKLLDAVTGALTDGATSRVVLEHAALALLGYVESSSDGFRILVRDSSAAATGSYATLLSDAARRVEHLLEAQFAKRGLARENAPIYAQALVGMVAFTGQWWLDARSPSKEVVAAHLVNLAWNGLAMVEPSPGLTTLPAPCGEGPAVA